MKHVNVLFYLILYTLLFDQSLLVCSKLRNARQTGNTEFGLMIKREFDSGLYWNITGGLLAEGNKFAIGGLPNEMQNSYSSNELYLWLVLISLGIGFFVSMCFFILEVYWLYDDCCISSSEIAGSLNNFLDDKICYDIRIVNF